MITASVTADASETSPEKTEREITVRLGAQPIEVTIEREGEQFFYHVRQFDGQTRRMTPEAFARWSFTRRDDSGSLMAKILNVTSPLGILWIVTGLLGQVLFTGRMLVQWLMSEKHGRSVVPPIFWWMSLAGASMLMIYFIWRQDIVGIIGQATGWGIYVRNLWLIYLPRNPDTTLLDGAA
ncbi:MAG: lipid-A-disaccharide synthase N-terminal domain-containing protein [Phycisphaeraceae bacterium]|nr:lipid-A-disaccharide synthase N-terminal domain-containing protein [Phycisphaeraceae bacterium]